eukprot:TRINITY_DN34898_c0_g1_i1.p1 TRINITY_DN34898_c0_g1~~TRINITY_DN34898_c0_g1_i1.p1  ORF type:complete len:550 (+),score=27.02 TRINITY_DN34898_c0_g1_i1:187-1650(+)
MPNDAKHAKKRLVPSCVDLLCLDVRFGFVYLSALFRRTFCSVILGLVVLTLPTGFFLNLASHALVKTPRRDGGNHSWEASLDPITWTDDDREALEVVAYMPLCVLRTLMLVAASHIATLAFIASWRGWEHIRSSKKLLVIFAFRDGMHAIIFFVYQTMLIYKTNLDHPILMGALSCLPYLVWFLMTGFLVSMSAPRKGGYQFVLGACLFLITIFVTWFVTGMSVRVSFFLGWYPRIGIMCFNSVVVKKCALAMAFVALGKFPEVQSAMHLVAGSIIIAFVSTVNTIITLGSDDLTMLVISSVFTVLSEIVEHNLWVQGISVKSICRWQIRRSRAQVQTFDAVVANAPIDMPDLTTELYQKLVTARNGHELYMIISVGALFLVAKTSPSTHGGEPLKVKQVVILSVLQLSIELVADFFTAVIARRLAPDCASTAFSSRRYEVNADWFAAVNAIVSSYMTLRGFAAMCPIPIDPSGGEFLSLGRCSSSG